MDDVAVHPDPRGDRRSFRSAVAWSYFATFSQRGLNVLLALVLAMVLGPRDFGTVAMASAFILVVEMLAVQGTQAAIIQQKQLSRRQLDAVFWLMLAASIVLMAAAMLMAGWWAHVNKLPVLAPVIQALAVLLPIRAAGTVQQALLRKRMAFRRLALLNTVAVLLGGGTAIAMVFNDGGVWSLVVQQIVSATASTVLFWATSGWRPRLRCRPRDAVRLLRFSGAVLTLQFGVYTANQCDALLLGLFFGPVAAGVYRLADRLMRMLLEVATRSVQSVALPHFARLQDDPAALRAAVESCIRLSATVAIPAMAVLAAVSEPFFSIMGEQWSASGSVLNVLVIMGVAKAITLFTGPLLLANGKPMVPAILTWTLGVITVGGITAIGIMAAHWPFDAQIISVAIVRTLIFVLLYGTASVVLTRRACGLPFNRFIRAAIPGLGAGSAAVSIGFLLEASGLLGHLPPVMRLVVQSTSSMVAALTTIVATDRNIRRYLVTRIVELTGDRIPVRPRSMHCPTE